MTIKSDLINRYPTAVCCAFGDSPELADQLASLIASGKKTGSCGSLAGCVEDNEYPLIGGYRIVENGASEPVCVIRTTRLQLVRFSEMTEELARKEGEGDLSLRYWRAEHERFFRREGTFSNEMELIFEEFYVVEKV
ncbi:ASCH domain-containing protein [Pseudenterobacter timonensis]|uniref:ASCH domain-containing protein n=1 Tax=Pseudenterobacter timonensis TaxID=1755099 RepID=A0AAE4DR57_9ENTR|nr:ASCH domain-containing protein [Pseudenterobacter timonensis]MDR9891513.1 ASCH domain-containing protein [Pseudenterobacter timonensis]